MYFYYKKDGKIYLVLSPNSNCDNWNTKELTSEEIGIPENSKIKYIKVYGTYGYIFYIAPDGIGGILKSTTEGDYWEKIKTEFVLNDNCELKFLNEYGMTADGFLTLLNDDNSKCDIYEVDDLEEKTFKKIDISNNTVGSFSSVACKVNNVSSEAFSIFCLIIGIADGSKYFAFVVKYKSILDLSMLNPPLLIII